MFLGEIKGNHPHRGQISENSDCALQLKKNDFQKWKFSLFHQRHGLSMS